mgnify:CR=1 FL=1
MKQLKNEVKKSKQIEKKVKSFAEIDIKWWVASIIFLLLTAIFFGEHLFGIALLCYLFLCHEKILVIFLRYKTMGKHAVELLGLDVGNAAVKAVGSSGSITFPHGLVELSQRSKDDYRMRGELDTNKNIWKVNGTYYKVGAAALEDGAGGFRGPPFFRLQRRRL